MMLTTREIHASLQLPIQFFVTINLTIYLITSSPIFNVRENSNQMQQYADIYLLQSHSTCFGCHNTHHQEY